MLLPWLRRVAIAVGSRTLSFILQAYVYTLCLHYGDLDPVRKSLAKGPVIFAFFHNRILLMPFSLPIGSPFRPVGVLISPSEDGTLVSKAVARFGAIPVRGSSSRGGKEARKELLASLYAGRNVGITPDGPKGPALCVKPGVIRLAQESGAPIVGLSWGASRCKRLGSWDRFVVPLPGSRVRFVFGKPLYLGAEEPFAECLAKVSGYMLDLTRETDPADPFLEENQQ